MECMPRAEQPLANSSGVAAPSRKLKAERACNSTYISHTLRAQTIFLAAGHNKNDTSRAQEVEIHREKQFPDPKRLPAKVAPPTIAPKSATVPMREPLFRSRLEMMQIPACSPVNERARVQVDEKRAGRWRELLLRNNDSNRFWNQQPRWKTSACEMRRAGANQTIAVNRPFLSRPRKRFARW